jgi:hypothetical protein
LNDGEVSKFIAETSEWCDEHAGVTLPPFHDVVDEWSPEKRAQLPEYAAEKAFKWPVLNTVVLPDEEFFERGFTTLVRATVLGLLYRYLIDLRMRRISSMTFTLFTGGICTTFGFLSYRLVLALASFR